jgi:uncharacterized protein YfaS (alpha-2-macroglobulin family)
LRYGTNWLDDQQSINITLGKQDISVQPSEKEFGTGYFRKTWNPADMPKNAHEIQVVNSGQVPAWGAAYWQYFEQLDRIQSYRGTPVQIRRELFKQVQTDFGPQLTPVTSSTPLSVGDVVQIRIVLYADRDMEYVHLKDSRAACFEPQQVLSAYRWEEGLDFYQSTRDLATHFFIGYLPKGSYVIQYDVRVTHSGYFSNGISQVQCMYAPEFSAHSEGITVHVLD